MAALGLGGVGVLLFFEIIRPFHDMSIDGPLALALWGVGAALGVVSLCLKGRSLTLGIMSLELGASARCAGAGADAPGTE